MELTLTSGVYISDLFVKSSTIGVVCVTGTDSINEYSSVGQLFRESVQLVEIKGLTDLLFAIEIVWF